jgi:hypothetical protein
MTLRAGDMVTYRAHPEWGTGRVDWAVPGLLHATFPQARPAYSGEFGPGELRHQKVSNTNPRIKPAP